MERKFLVLIRRFRLQKEQYLYFSTFGCSFLRLRGKTRRFLSTISDNLKLCGFGDLSW